MISDIDNAFAPSKKSVSWAQEAIAELYSSAKGFFDNDATEIVTEFDVQTGENVKKVRLRRALPASLTRKATEALINTRHSFDQALFAANSLMANGKPPQANFPWAQTPVDLKHILQARKIDQRLWSVIEGHEPYPRSDTHTGGNDLIRALATLANKKHTVGLGVGGRITGFGFPQFQAKSVRSMKILQPRWDPVQSEAELMRWIGDVEVDRDYTFRFEIILKDAGLSKPVGVFRGLNAFAAKAEVVIESLQARCVDILL